MYQPSSNMPIENYSIVQPSTQQRTFTENNICRFSVPFNSLPFFDPHNSYLQLLMESDATTKLELNGDASVLVKYLRLSVNGVVLEEIDEYNQLARLYNVYGNDDSSRSHSAVFTNDSSEGMTAGLMGNQSAGVAAVPATSLEPMNTPNAPLSVQNGVKKVKMVVPLSCCGLFSNLEIVPLMALGDNLDIEIRFAPNSEVVKIYNRQSGQIDGSEGNVGNFKTIIPVVAKAITNGDNVITGGAGGHATYTLKMPYKGFSSAGDIPLQAGECVTLLTDVGVQDSAGNSGDTALTTAGGANANIRSVFKVVSVARLATSLIGAGQTITTDNPNQLVITLTTTDGANAITSTQTANVVALSKTRPTNIDVADPAQVAPTISRIQYTNVELYFQKVMPPQQYVEQLKKQLSSPQGFQMDLHTWTTYKSTLLQAVRNQTIEIPAYQSRAKSVLVIPRVGQQTPSLPAGMNNNITDDATAVRPRYDFRGKHAGLADYQFQVNNGLRVPTRPVNLEVMNGSFNHLSAEHLIQITQALGASNIGVKSIKEAKDDFVMGRQLSKYGGTTNLNSAMRVYVNYTGDLQPVPKLQPITFVNHINRVAVNASGLQVFN